MVFFRRSGGRFDRSAGGDDSAVADFAGFFDRDPEDPGDVDLVHIVDKHVDTGETATNKRAGYPHFDACPFGKRSRSSRHLGLEGFVSGFVFLHLHIPTDEAGGKARVLAATTDSLGKLFLVHLHEDGLLRLIDRDRLDLGGFQGLLHKGAHVVAPADDIHLLVVEFADDILNAGATHADTGTDRIDFFVSAVDRDLGAVAGFTGERADLHRAIGDFADLGFKKTTHEVRMTARKNDLRSARPVLNRDNVGPDAVTDVVFLGRDPLALVHDTLEFAEIDKDITALKATDGPADDVTGTILEFFVNQLFLRLTETLHHRLLRGLCSNSAEI